MSDILELNCWILREDKQRVFLVEVEKDKSVGALKDLIKVKKSHALQHVDAGDIEVWKVKDAIPVDDNNLSGKIHCLGIPDDQPLKLNKRLSGLFPTPPADENLHIVVRVPDYPASSRDTARPAETATPPRLIMLNCWVLPDDADRVFPVEIVGEKTVGALKKAIKDEKKQRLHSIDADRLDLWKVSIPPENRHDVLQDLQHPEHVDKACKIDPTDLLTNVFQDYNYAKHVHIIVQVPLDPGAS